MALNLKNAKEKFINALFGVPAEVEQPDGNVEYLYNTQRQTDFMQGLPNNKDLLGKIKASPYNQGYTDQEIINRVAQGQNFGLSELANEQREWGIKLPRANNELDEEAVRGNYLNVYQPKLQTGATTTPRQGGFFNDLAQGYKENTSQGFDVQNWLPQEKSFVTRLGEGLGSVARFADSPLGRGLIAYGLSKSVGDDNPLKQGIIAGVGRQGNITRDKAYRQNLQQMGYTPEEINSIPGIVSDDIYSNLIRAKQLQDNAEYRNMMLKVQQDQNNIMNKIREASLEEDIKRNAFNQNMDLAKLGIEREKLKQGGENKPITFSNMLSLANHFDSLPEVKNFKEIDRQFSNVDKTYNAYLKGELKANAADQAMVTTLNKILDPTSVVRESEFARTAAGQSAFARLQGYFDKISKGGGGLTNAEREDLFNTMKLMRESAYDTYQSTAETYKQQAIRHGINPEDIIRYKSNYASTQNSGQMKKMKAPDGKIYNVPIEKVETMKAKGGVVIDG